MQAKPFTPETLALRWKVSAATIRNQCNEKTLPHFRLGRLYRIPAAIVEEIETCQTSVSDDSETVSASIGARTESEGVISLRHVPERTQSRKQ